MSISKWNAGNIGEIVKLLMRYRNPITLLEQQRDVLNRLIANYNAIIDELAINGNTNAT